MKIIICILQIFFFTISFGQTINYKKVENACRYNDHTANDIANNGCEERRKKEAVNKNATPCVPDGNWAVVLFDDFNSPVLDQEKWYEGWDRGNPMFCHEDKDLNIYTDRRKFVENWVDISNGTYKVKLDRLPTDELYRCGWSDVKGQVIGDELHVKEIPNGVSVIPNRICSFIQSNGQEHSSFIQSQISGVPNGIGVYRLASFAWSNPNIWINVDSRVYKYGSTDFGSRKQFRHGLFEARIKIPDNIYANPSFWLRSNSCEQEVDVFELFGETIQLHYKNWKSRLD